jgi:hypothetical protein
LAQNEKTIQIFGRKWPKSEKSSGIPVENGQKWKNQQEFWLKMIKM